MWFRVILRNMFRLPAWLCRPRQGIGHSGVGVFFSRPDDRPAAFNWQRASAAALGKSGCVLWFYKARFAGRQQNEGQLPSRSPCANDPASGSDKIAPTPEFLRQGRRDWNILSEHYFENHSKQ